MGNEQNKGINELQRRADHNKNEREMALEVLQRYQKNIIMTLQNQKNYQMITGAIYRQI